jgi:hypothetical protein
MSDEKIDPSAPRVHVGVGNVVEKQDGNFKRAAAPPALPASRRCLATIPENLNDIWWRDAKVDKPVDEEPVLFRTDTDVVRAGCRVLRGGGFHWTDGHLSWDEAVVTHWMPQPSRQK